MTRTPSRSSASLGVVLCGLLLQCTSLDAPEHLELEEDVWRSIEEGDVHVYRLDLAAGELVWLDVEQRGADVGMRVHEAAGDFVFGVDSFYWEAGTERLLWEAPETGRFELRVHCWNTVELEARGNEEGTRAAYRFTRSEIRPTRDVDAPLVQATQALHRHWTWSDATDGAPDCERALRLSLQAEDPGGIAEANYCLARSLVEQDPARAAELFENGARTPGVARYVTGYGLRRAGVVEDKRGRPERAAALLEEALEIARAGGGSFTSERAFTAQSLGVVLHRLGELSRGIVLLDEAIEGWRRAGQSFFVAEALRHRGALRFDALEFDLALDDLESALAETSPDDRAGRAQTLRYMATALLGRARRSQGSTTLDAQRAVELLRESAGAYEELDDSLNHALVEAELGLALLRVGETEAAEVAQRSALTRLENAGLAAESVQHRIGLVRRNLGLVMETHGDLKAAERHLRRAIEDLVSRRPVDEASTHADLARILWRSGDLVQARQVAERSVERVEGRRLTASDWHSRATFFDGVVARYDLLVRILLDLEGREPERGHALAALAIHERARARTFLERLAGANGSVGVRGQGASPELDVVEAQLRSLQAQRIAVASESQSRRSVYLKSDAEVERAIRELLPRRRALLSRDEARQAAHAGDSGTRTETAQTLQAPELSELLTLGQHLGARRALVQYHFGSHGAFVWILRGDSVKAHELPWDSASGALLVRARQLLRHAEASKPPLSGALEATLVALSESLGLFDPFLVEELEGAAELVVVPDGRLRTIPFGALRMAHRETPLGARFSIATVPSASTWIALERRTAARDSTATRFGVVGDPVTEAVAQAETTHPPGTDAPRIEGAAREAQLLIELLPSARDVTLTSQPLVLSRHDANRDLVLSSGIDDLRFLHFAVHGLADDRYPELNALLLSTYDATGAPIDGLLTAMDFERLDLSAELVVLSACSTALGEELRSEGVLGLVRPILVSGANSVLASLWPVDDLATADLMSAFYREMLSGASPAEALRRARASFLAEPRRSSPVLWSAFVLYGAS